MRYAEKTLFKEMKNIKIKTFALILCLWQA
jgi:hypothetical protein